MQSTPSDPGGPNSGARLREEPQTPPRPGYPLYWPPAPGPGYSSRAQMPVWAWVIASLWLITPFVLAWSTFRFAPWDCAAFCHRPDGGGDLETLARRLTDDYTVGAWIAMPALILASLRWRGLWLVIATIATPIAVVGLVGFVDVVLFLDLGFSGWLSFGITWPVSLAVIGGSLYAWVLSERQQVWRPSLLAVVAVASVVAIIGTVFVTTAGSVFADLIPVGAISLVVAAAGWVRLRIEG